MTVFVVDAFEAPRGAACTGCSHCQRVAGVATSYTGAVDLAWADAQAHPDTFDAYVIMGFEPDTPGRHLHNTYFDRGDTDRDDLDVLRFREGWETLATSKVPYEDPRRIVLD